MLCREPVGGGFYRKRIDHGWQRRAYTGFSSILEPVCDVREVHRDVRDVSKDNH